MRQFSKLATVSIFALAAVTVFPALQDGHVPNAAFAANEDGGSRTKLQYLAIARQPRLQFHEANAIP